MAEPVDVLMITHRRPDYLRLSLPRLIAATGDHVRIWLWHNGGHEPTLGFVREYADHPRVAKFHHSADNVGLTPATNWFWTNSDAPYLGKVDDDCLVDHAWTEPLVAAHEDNPAFGVIGAWRFLDEDFRPRLAHRKIAEFRGRHRVLQNLWVQGSSYVMKRAVVDTLGPLRHDESFTQYCIRAAEAGFINGWLYPFVRERHLDDPRFRLSQLRTDEDLAEQAPLSAKLEAVSSIKQWEREMAIAAYRVQRASLDPAHYRGLRWKLGEVPKRIRRFARTCGFNV